MITMDHHGPEGFDSLDGFVAIKLEPFKDDATKKKLQFHVAWNSIESKLAITCLARSRKVSDKQSEGWGGVFSFHELSSIHDQLCLVHPILTPYLPELPYEPRGLWAYLTSMEAPQDSLCHDLEKYLQTALDVCGQKLLISTLFEEQSYEHYFEKISEFKRRFYDEEIQIAENELQNVIFHRDNSLNMCDMCEVYQLEDTALNKLNTAIAQLYNYMLQPFLDMRELSYGKVREAKDGLQNPDFGERRKAEFAKMFSEWQASYVDALDNIHDLYIEYYTKTVELLQDAKERMIVDKKKFGKASFQIAGQSRFNRVLEDMSKERLQLLRATKKQKEHQRDKVKQEIASLDEKVGVSQDLQRLEKNIYQWQMEIYDVHMEILDEEETLLKRRLDAIREETQAKEIEIEFYDAVEEQEDLNSDSDDLKPKIDPRIAHLRSKLAAVHRHRAQIRNKRKAFVRMEENKKQRKVEEKEKFKQHHTIHLKREEQKKELERKQPILQEERKKTLQRLKQYKMKYPTPATIRPPRYLSPSQKTARNSPSPNSANQKLTSNGHVSENKKVKESSPVHCETSGHKPTVYTSTNVEAKDTQLTVEMNGATAPVVPPPPPPPPGAAPPPPPPPPPPGPPPLQITTDSHRKSVRKEEVDKPQGGGSIVDRASIQDALKNLKKPANGSQKVHRVVNPMDDMMQLIRQGVKLRKVSGLEKDLPNSSPSEEHTNKLQEVLERIRKNCADSDEEEDEQDFSD